MKLISPYRNVIQYTRISLEPYQMNNDILNNLKKNLKNKVEKKCNRNGFVNEVHRIIEYTDGIIPAENLNGSAIYDISYHCSLCIPIENTLIIGNVRILNQELIIAINGPILIFIQKENIDTTIWNILDNYEHKQLKKKIEINEFIKIQIVDKRVNQNDNQIIAIGNLSDFATPDEIDTFFINKNDNNYIT